MDSRTLVLGRKWPSENEENPENDTESRSQGEEGYVGEKNIPRISETRSRLPFEGLGKEETSRSWEEGPIITHYRRHHQSHFEIPGHVPALALLKSQGGSHSMIDYIESYNREEAKDNWEGKRYSLAEKTTNLCDEIIPSTMGNKKVRKKGKVGGSHCKMQNAPKRLASGGPVLPELIGNQEPERNGWWKKFANVVKLLQRLKQSSTRIFTGRSFEEGRKLRRPGKRDVAGKRDRGKETS